MKKTLVTILVVIVLILALGIAGGLGFVWYRDNHVFVDGDAYDITTRSLDLTAEDISLEYYEELQSKLPDCSIRWTVPFHNGKYANDTQSLTVSELTLEDVEFLVRYFPELKTLDVVPLVNKGGTIILSGILDELYPEVKAKYESLGLTEKSSKLVGEWRTGLFVN